MSQTPTGKQGSMKTSYSQVEGLGSARSGGHHWWVERVVSAALIPLTVLFLVPFIQAIGESYYAARELYEHPFHATVAILFILIMFYHLKMGLQVVIEDYVSSKAWRTGLVLANLFYCVALGVFGVISVLRLTLIS